jgi:hypothetical protein
MGATGGEKGARDMNVSLETTMSLTWGAKGLNMDVSR